MHSYSELVRSSSVMEVFLHNVKEEILFTQDFQKGSQLTFFDVILNQSCSLLKTLSLTNIILSVMDRPLCRPFYSLLFLKVYTASHHLQLLLLCGCAGALTKKIPI